MIFKPMIYAILLICCLKITTEIARCGLLQIVIQRRPINHKVFENLLIGIMAVLFCTILQMVGWEFTLTSPEHIDQTLMIFLGAPLFWFIIFRYMIMPKGKDSFAHNRARIRTDYWSEYYHCHGLFLKNERRFLIDSLIIRKIFKLFNPNSFSETKRRSLRNSWLAKRTVKLFKKALTSEEKGTMFFDKENNTIRSVMTVDNLNNIAEISQELALLYRMMNLYLEAHDALRLARSQIEKLIEIDAEKEEYLKLKSRILFNKAETYHAQGIELEEAKKLYEESLDIDRRVGNNSEQIEKIKTLIGKVVLL